MAFDKELYKQIMSRPEGLPHRLYRKALGYYVTRLSDAVKQAMLARRDEIYEAETEWQELNLEVLQRLGFRYGEAEMLKDKRLDSPGMRNVIRNRAEELGYVRRARVKV